jgi:hypothetical protein
MEKRESWIFPVVVGACVLLLVSVPYAFAAQKGGSAYVFGGFLLNPQDGNSYLAKMYQGMAGAWRFRLPFSAEPGEGAYLFLFYLGLGHVARVTHLPALAVFHLVRVASSAVLLWALWDFWRRIFEDEGSRRLAFGLSALGSGSGWLLVASGGFTSDFWVAEGYPFLSMYSNPHFPFGLALTLWLLRPNHGDWRGWQAWIRPALGGLVLSALNPFGVVIVGMVLGGNWLWLWVRKAPVQVITRRLIAISVAGLPLLVYDVWVANQNPALRGWNAQNLTPSPAWWDLVVSLSPALLVGCLGLVAWVRKAMGGVRVPDGTLVAWLVLGITAMYLPLGLQRRFMMGLFVPVAGLATLGLESLGEAKPSRIRLAKTSLVILSLPTNLIILLAAFGGMRALEPSIYLTKGERHAIQWIEEHTASDDIILASPEMGLFIPAYSGRRVLYGHPFETVNADRQEALVRRFFQEGGQTSAVERFVKEQGVGYVLLGPREEALGNVTIPDGWALVFDEGGVRVYRVEDW